MSNPVIEFGLCALASALSARTGGWTSWDVIRLQATTLRCVPEDAAAREMVLDFVGAVRGDACRAGEVLQRAVYAWLDALPGALRDDIMKSANAGTLYEWQKRADLQ